RVAHGHVARGPREHGREVGGRVARRLGDHGAAMRARVYAPLDLGAALVFDSAVHERERDVHVDAFRRRRRAGGTAHGSMVRYDRTMSDADPVAAVWQRCRTARPALAVELEAFRAY